MTRQGSTTVLFCAATLCVFTLYCLGAIPLQPHRDIQKRQTKLDCTTNLSRDLYGLGVRLGIYFQWFSGWVSNNFIVEEVSGGLDANSIFMFALLISIVNTTSNSTLTQIDAFIMIQLCAGTIWSVLSIWGYRTCLYRKEGLDAIRRFGGFGTHLRLLLAGAVSWYSIWFWTSAFQNNSHGLSPFGPQSDPACGNVVLFNVPIAGPIKGFTLGIGIASTVYNLLLTAAAPLAAITRIRKIVIFLRSGHLSASTRLRYGTGATENQLHTMSLVFGAFNLIWIMFMMTLIEITLNENRIYGVLGGTTATDTSNLLQPGQLIPMLIGAFSFTRCLFIAFELYRNPNGDISPSLGRHESRRAAAHAQDLATTQGHNPLKLFSTANEIHEEESHFLEHKSDDDSHEKEVDPFFELHKRLTVFQRIMITWLPWLSLLFFWPWTENRGVPAPPKRDHSPAPAAHATTPPRTRYSDYDTEMTSMDTSYNKMSHGSIDGEQAQQPLRMV